MWPDRSSPLLLALSLIASPLPGQAAAGNGAAGYRGAVPAAGTQLAAVPAVFDSQGMTLLSWVSLQDLGELKGNDCWGYTSPSGREYAIICTWTATTWVEITDPQNPVIVAQHPGPGGTTWRDVKVYDHYAYAVSEAGQGIQVFDMDSIDAGTVAYLGDVTTGGATNTHNVAIDETSGFLYRCDTGSAGMLVYDLKPNPAVPVLVGTYNGSSVHDAQVVTYPGGQEIAFCATGNAFRILDVSNKGSIVQLSSATYPNLAFAHQVWISDDRQYAYFNDESDEINFGVPSTTHVFDISNLSNVTLLNTYDNGISSTDHNLYVRGNLIFAANNMSGLRVFDRTDPVNPVEVAYFDTQPNPDYPGFVGLWSNFPFFPSGLVIGSDRSRGLFVWRVGDPLLTLDFVGGAPGVLSPGGQASLTTISETTPGVLVGGTAQLHYDDGSGLQSVPMPNVGGASHQAAFPPLACGSQVKYFISAETTDGLTWFDPPQAPASFHTAIVAQAPTTVVAHDMEFEFGWSAGDVGDNASSGTWVRVDPNGTGIQPEDDFSPSGTLCWVTGQGAPGASVSSADVDGGKTTLLSPPFDVGGLQNPVASYWRWYSNSTSAIADDEFRVDIDGGQGWVNVETIDAGDPDSSPGWRYHEFRVTDFVPLGSTIRLRFVAEDVSNGTIVEAAIDDFELRDVPVQRSRRVLHGQDDLGRLCRRAVALGHAQPDRSESVRDRRGAGPEPEAGAPVLRVRRHRAAVPGRHAVRPASAAPYGHPDVGRFVAAHERLQWRLHVRLQRSDPVRQRPAVDARCRRVRAVLVPRSAGHVRDRPLERRGDDDPALIWRAPGQVGIRVFRPRLREGLRSS